MKTEVLNRKLHLYEPAYPEEVGHEYNRWVFTDGGQTRCFWERWSIKSICLEKGIDLSTVNIDPKCFKQCDMCDYYKDVYKTIPAYQI